jgi:predicted permease
MISHTEVLFSAMPVYILILTGVILRMLGVVGREHIDASTRLVYSVLVPCFILDKILGSQSIKSSTIIFSSMALGFGMIVVGIVISHGFGKLIGLEKGNGRRTFALACGCQNFGFNAAPVVEILWGSSALAVLFVHNIGVELAIWSVGVLVMNEHGGIPWRRVINGPLIAVLAGVLVVATDLDAHCTGPARKALSMAGAGAFPIGIMITGAAIMDLAHTEKPMLRIALGSVVVRLLLVPTVFLVLAKFLPIADGLRQILIVQAAMPAAMTPIILARMYGGRPAIAVHAVITTTVASLLTLPWIISLGCRWIGLKPLLP